MAQAYRSHAYRVIRRAYSVTCNNGRAAYREASINNNIIHIHPEVEEALETGKPVVALESAVITHGLPSPLNLRTAASLEEKVRRTGCIPATIAMLSGKIHVGLTIEELETLSESNSTSPLAKISRRDLGPAISSGRSGGTTVSGTMIIAHLTGINFFATGGLGGVHRGGEISMDISADLTELGKTPVGVVASGAKAILDIGRTLEYLETQGVPVVTFGPSYDFPAFYTPKSGYKVPWRVDTALQAADIYYKNRLLGLTCGTFFAAPIPEEHAAEAAVIQDAIEQAIGESEAARIRGKDVTPFLLRRVAELSRGSAIQSNIALLENCATIAGNIAREYSLLRQTEARSSSPATVPWAATRMPSSTGAELPRSALRPIVIVGAAAVDVTARLTTGNEFASSSTLPGTVDLTLGGVARNMSEAAHRILKASGIDSSAETLLLSPVAHDMLGFVLKQGLHRIGQRTDGLINLQNVENKTGVCNMVLDYEGNLVGGVVDTAITEELAASEVTVQLGKHDPSIVGFDANLQFDTMGAILSHCRHRDIPALFEPTSIAKCSRVLSALTPMMTDSGDAILAFMTPNILELQAMYQEARNLGLFSSTHWWTAMNRMNLAEGFRNDMDSLSKLSTTATASHASTSLRFLITEGISQMAMHFLPFVSHLFVKLGSHGVLVAVRMTEKEAKQAQWHEVQSSMAERRVVIAGNGDRTVFQHFPADELPTGTALNVTGAGDAFAGAILAGLHETGTCVSPVQLTELVTLGQRAALLTLQSDLSVSPAVSHLAAGCPLFRPR